MRILARFAKRQAGQVSRHLHVFTNFRVAKTCKNSACWGAPQTRNFGPTWPEVGALRLMVAVMFASLHFLVYGVG